MASNTIDLRVDGEYTVSVSFHVRASGEAAAIAHVERMFRFEEWELEGVTEGRSPYHWCPLELHEALRCSDSFVEGLKAFLEDGRGCTFAVEGDAFPWITQGHLAVAIPCNLLGEFPYANGKRAADTVARVSEAAGIVINLEEHASGALTYGVEGFGLNRSYVAVVNALHPNAVWKRADTESEVAVAATDADTGRPVAVLCPMRLP